MTIITLKVEADVKDIPYQYEYSSIFRFAYERWVEGKTEIDIRALVKQIWTTRNTNSTAKHKVDVNCWLAQCAIKEAKKEYKAHKEQIKSGQRKKKVIWGGRNNFEKLKNNKITKDVFKKLRLRPLVVQGEQQYESNRLFDLNNIKNGIITYWPNRYTSIDYKFKIHPYQIDQINYISQNIGILPIQVLLKEGQICFSFEQEKQVLLNQIENRILGIDMNPNYIGISIVDFKNNKETLVKSICYKISNNTRRNDNKRNHETIQIGHNIIKVAKHYRCNQISIEDLTMGSKDNGLGKNFNRLCNNEWNRNQLVWTIEKLSDKNNIVFKQVNCAYSSTIGNIMNRYLFDPCASAFEIARRGHYQYVSELCMYPPVKFSEINILNQWKKEGYDFTKCINWKVLHDDLKSSKLKYRVMLDDIKSSIRDFCCRNSGISILSNFYYL